MVRAQVGPQEKLLNAPNIRSFEIMGVKLLIPVKPLIFGNIAHFKDCNLSKPLNTLFGRIVHFTETKYPFTEIKHTLEILVLLIIGF